MQYKCHKWTVALNEKYRSLADRIGVKPEYDRGFVQGFRDVKVEKPLTSGRTSGTMASEAANEGSKRLSWLQKGYDRAVEKGDVSALTGFDHYEKVATTAEKELIGITTSNGMEIKGYKTHFIDRVIGSYIKKREPVEIDIVKKALTNPLTIKKNRPEKSQPSDVYVTDECFVTVNPNTKTLIQVSPRRKAT